MNDLTEFLAAGLTDSGWCCKTCEAVASAHGDMYPETPGLEVAD